MSKGQNFTLPVIPVLVPYVVPSKALFSVELAGSRVHDDLSFSGYQELPGHAKIALHLCITTSSTHPASLTWTTLFICQIWALLGSFSKFYFRSNKHLLEAYPKRTRWSQNLPTIFSCIWDPSGIQSQDSCGGQRKNLLTSAITDHWREFW